MLRFAQHDTLLPTLNVKNHNRGTDLAVARDGTLAAQLSTPGKTGRPARVM